MPLEGLGIGAVDGVAVDEPQLEEGEEDTEEEEAGDDVDEEELDVVVTRSTGEIINPGMEKHLFLISNLMKNYEDEGN